MLTPKWFQGLMSSTFLQCYLRMKGHTSAENMILRKQLRNILSLKNVVSLFFPFSLQDDFLPPGSMWKRLDQSVGKMGTEYNELSCCELDKWWAYIPLLYETGEGGTWCSLHSLCSNAHTSHASPANQQSAINETTHASSWFMDSQTA